MLTSLRARIRDLSKQVVNGPNALKNRFDAIGRQLDRIDDRLARVEEGLEAAGMLTKESRLKIRNLEPENLAIEESFDYIYMHGGWTDDPSKSSGSGSYGSWAENFVALAKDFIHKHDVHSITDIGCGDFNVGSQICSSVDLYQALDVSREIIRRDTERFRDLPQVTFRQANACVDPLPRADLAIIRQVLQHLTNAQIEDLLQNVARTGFRYVLIAEHSPLDDKLVKPNFDLKGQSNKIRLRFGSGVYLDQPPFSRPVRRIAQFKGEGGQLIVYIWVLSNSVKSADVAP
jgi:hypothetical protein